VLRFLQQPLEALLRRGVPAVARGAPVGVEVAAPLGLVAAVGVAPLAEVEHQGLQALPLKLRHAVAGAQGLAVFRQHHLGHRGQRAGRHQVGLAPVEQFGGQQLEAGHHLDRLARRALALLQQGLQQGLQLALARREVGGALVGEQLQPVQHRWRHHQAHGLHQAEPLLVGVGAGGERGHQLVGLRGISFSC